MRINLKTNIYIYDNLNRNYFTMPWMDITVDKKQIFFDLEIEIYGIHRIIRAIDDKIALKDRDNNILNLSNKKIRKRTKHFLIKNNTVLHIYQNKKINQKYL